MSISGIRSNRGDGYQTLVAFEWAITVLSNPQFQWIEIDSTAYAVDDVVVGKVDGTLICCQCKKNQIDFKAWTITDLRDELDKACNLLANNRNAEVRFYSRNSFGKVAKLREHSTTQSNEAGYQASLDKENAKTDAHLAALLATHKPTLSTYEFLHRTIFETSPELDRTADLLQERLRFIASNAQVAYDALWRRLDQLGARIEGGDISAASQHRLTKDDLKTILHEAGAMLVPIMSCAEVRASFASTSGIGRSWHREIAGQRIRNTVLNDLLLAIDAKKRAILLTGLPGSGKTCVMLDLQEALEHRAQIRSDIVPLFIQAREFADLATTQDRQAQGLPELWVEKAARMAEEAQVIVVIDSLDVLSIAREHRVLTYFLAQVDRLLLIPNVTVVTACRDFDRHYDRRIAERRWDCELKCLPLNWEGEIAPLLGSLGIHTSTIDAVTRELIRNPRELALFVELAMREGSFNIVTSQALAQRYLDVVVRANASLGEEAVQAIEAVAAEMLKSRSFAVQHQRFTASQEIRRLLCSLNVLQETQKGDLTFGHQTLLDVLVISGAVRRGVTLNEFIHGLPPVPFVRPSIRSFVAQLAMGERHVFRKQLRAVLTGSAAFHIRRLVAESLAEQRPQDDDWPLIRDLHNNHRDVFQAIYTHARFIEWHHFWLAYLVPVLKEKMDADGLAAHVYRIAQWKDEDAAGVLAFWTDILSLTYVDGKQIAWRLPYFITEMNERNLAFAAPLLKRLLSMPRQEHNSLGHALARCIKTGSIEDGSLWQYIVSDINDEDVIQYRFNNKLHCLPHEFGNRSENFLLQRMKHSTTLLDSAVASIEQWSRIKSDDYGDMKSAYFSEFLHQTSYDKVHSQHDTQQLDSDDILLSAMEAAILGHAKSHSDWWKVNRERLCFCREGALRYIAILACTADPEPNIDLIGRILRDKAMLESNLSYEVGTLMQAAFMHLDSSAQDAVLASVMTVREDWAADVHQRNWVLKERAEFVVTIPCHLRSSEAQAVLDNYIKSEGVLIRQPEVLSRGGMVRDPFSFDLFLRVEDSGVLQLLAHYAGHDRIFSDSLVGGERAVGGQLREASSRQPVRFLNLLSAHWPDIYDVFCDDIMDGVANYLAYRYGNLRPDGNWAPFAEVDAPALANYIIDELERHPEHWKRNRAASNAIQACAHVIKDTQNAARLVFLAIDFASLREESTIKGDSVDLITTGINMMSGHLVEALMILAGNFSEHNIPFPELLSPTLSRFARNEHPAIRALILRRLPYLQAYNSELGWHLFYLVMQDAEGLWQIAEPCLYYTYHNNFEKIAPLLVRIRKEGIGNEMETWGRISALAALTKQIDIFVLLNDLKTLENTEAWRGASGVWTHSENIKQHREQCLLGIETGLKANGTHAKAVAQQMEHMFHHDNGLISIPIDLIRQCFSVFENSGDNENKNRDLFWFDEWLNKTAHQDPEQALAAAEVYLAHVRRNKLYLYDYQNNLTQLMTRLFAEAEEREESDRGEMLQRVVSLQDLLLSLGGDGIDAWLKAAERP
jgi:hypothetical protein